LLRSNWSWRGGGRRGLAGPGGLLLCFGRLPDRLGGVWPSGSTSGGRGVRLRQRPVRALVRASGPEAVPQTATSERRSEAAARVHCCQHLDLGVFELRSTVILRRGPFGSKLGCHCCRRRSSAFSGAPVHPEGESGSLGATRIEGTRAPPPECGPTRFAPVRERPSIDSFSGFPGC